MYANTDCLTSSAMRLFAKVLAHFQVIAVANHIHANHRKEEAITIKEVEDLRIYVNEPEDITREKRSYHRPMESLLSSKEVPVEVQRCGKLPADRNGETR